MSKNTDKLDDIQVDVSVDDFGMTLAVCERAGCGWTWYSKPTVAAGWIAEHVETHRASAAPCHGCDDPANHPHAFDCEEPAN